MQLRIVGSGLIGTSIGLGARTLGHRVEMIDSDHDHQRLAQDLMGGHFQGSADFVILALPSSKLPMVLEGEFELNPQSIFMDVGSTKIKPQQDVDKIFGLSANFCGTHPMAGREIGGPEGARGDLFEGRPWIICPSASTAGAVTAEVGSFVTSLGATAIEMSGPIHDQTVALISHLPQIAASLLAKQLVGADPERLGLSGQGLRDTTRIAFSDPELWRDIISVNREAILPLLASLHSDLGDFMAAMSDPGSIEDLIRAGNAGVHSIPGKHGGRARNYSYLPIVIEDKPGQLAALFDECAAVSVNVEDLTIEHSPGQFTGLITLALSESDGVKLATHLGSQGWKVHSLR